MPKFARFFLLLLCGQLCYANPVCYPDRATASSKCTNDFKGVQVGPRCYYIASDTTMDWDGTWARCKADGASMAELQTHAEYTAVRDYLRAKYPGAAADAAGTSLALRDDTKDDALPKITLDTTFWFTDQATTASYLNAGNTYVRTFRDPGISEGPTHKAPRCFTIFTNFKHIFDNTCGAKFRPFCHMINSAQQFKKTTSCLQETPMATINAASKEDCAADCSQRLACRSFNVQADPANPSGVTCDMFSWSGADIGSVCGPDENRACANATTIAGCSNYYSV